MRRSIKLLCYILLTVPAIDLIYKLLTNQLGAQPADHLNKSLGEITIYLLLGNLYWGACLALIKRPPRWLIKLHTLRRPLGVACFIYAVLHFSFFFIKEGDFALAWNELLSKTYLKFGLAALLILTALAATSNNLSVRKLKMKRWKNLHRFVYLAFALATVHILLIEKKPWWVYGPYLFPFAALLLWRGLRFAPLPFDARRPKKEAGT